MTVNEWKEDFKGYINALDMPRDDYKSIMEYIDEGAAMLKEQEESIPVSWLEEKLVGHPELSYAVTDGINNVLDLWEGR